MILLSLSLAFVRLSNAVENDPAIVSFISWNTLFKAFGKKDLIAPVVSIPTGFATNALPRLSSLIMSIISPISEPESVAFCLAYFIYAFKSKAPSLEKIS